MSSKMPSSPSSQAVSGAEIVVQSLIRHGVDTVFAYPGGASMPLHQALTRFRDRLRVILPRSQHADTLLADGDRLEIDQKQLGSRMSGAMFLALIDAIRTMGHSGEGHCRME